MVVHRVSPHVSAVFANPRAGGGAASGMGLFPTRVFVAASAMTIGPQSDVPHNRPASFSQNAAASSKYRLASAVSTWAAAGAARAGEKTTSLRLSARPATLAERNKTAVASLSITVATHADSRVFRRTHHFLSGVRSQNTRVRSQQGATKALFRGAKCSTRGLRHAQEGAGRVKILSAYDGMAPWIASRGLTASGSTRDLLHGLRVHRRPAR